MRTSPAILAVLCSAVSMIGLPAITRAAEADAAASMQSQMQRLLDREAILDLLVTYGRLLDARDLVGYSKLFAADGVWEGGIGSATGPKGIQQMLETVYGRVEPGRFGIAHGAYHIMSDFRIDIAGDTATSWSRWTWVVEGKDGRPEIQRSGHYEDQLAKEAGQWRFKRRLTVTEMPTPAKDSEARIFRRDHRDKN